MSKIKGIILAGGKGTRLYPSTKVSSKQLLPVYDKPMIYYPLSTLMIAGIKEILIISNPNEIILYESLLGNGKNLGLKLQYAIQEKPKGLADAFLVGEKFIGSSKVALILGDNLFYGSGFGSLIRSASSFKEGAVIFGMEVNNPSEYGIAKLNSKGKIIDLIEKPKSFISNVAIPGLYFYDNKVVSFAKNLSPSKRGEIEITDLNRLYLKKDQINIVRLPRGIAWMDTGTPSNYFKASEFVRIMEERTGKKIACLEEVAFLSKLIDKKMLKTTINSIPESDYKLYLKNLI